MNKKFSPKKSQKKLSEAEKKNFHFFEISDPTRRKFEKFFFDFPKFPTEIPKKIHKKIKRSNFQKKMSDIIGIRRQSETINNGTISRFRNAVHTIHTIHSPRFHRDLIAALAAFFGGAPTSDNPTLDDVDSISFFSDAIPANLSYEINLGRNRDTAQSKVCIAMTFTSIGVSMTCFFFDSTSSPDSIDMSFEFDPSTVSFPNMSRLKNFALSVLPAFINNRIK